MPVQEIIQRYPNKSEYLIEMLIDVDATKPYHFISESEIKQIAEYINVKESHVCSVMSFYTLLSTKKRGRHIIQVCKDVPCYLNDSFNVLQTIQDELNIQLNQTTKDELFTLEQTACIGCCDQAPAMRVDHEVFTNLTRDKVIHILESYRGDTV